MRWFIAILAGLILLVSAVALGVRPAPLERHATYPDLPDNLDEYLSDSEKRAASEYALIPRTEKRIVWQTPGQVTDVAIVYLHGLSATRQELAPTPELVANALSANLFETRLAGHGREEGALVGVDAEDWLADAAEAFAIGARIGEQVVVIGTSTGATLALAMAQHPLIEPVAAIVLISPNFAPKDSAARWLTRPGGPLFARYLIGDTYSWKPHSQTQARYWTTSYPTAALIEMMRTVDFVQSELPLTLSPKLLMLLSRRDAVVSADAALRAFGKIDAPAKRLVEFGQVGDPSQHVLAGHILSADTTDAVVEHIVNFLRSSLAIESTS